MNYSHIAAAVEHYSSRGYNYVPDAPWYVEDFAYETTKPRGSVDVQICTSPGSSQFSLRDFVGNLVASGEQSFIQMLDDGFFLKRAICVTPCFRWEKNVSATHKQYFMKAELINAQDVDRGHMVDMIHDACCFFEKFLPGSVRVVQVGLEPQNVQYDIVEKETRLELGSYGIREARVKDRMLRWIYGTGCAEPRLSTVIDRLRRYREI